MNWWQGGQGVVLAVLVLINLSFYFAFERTHPSAGQLIVVADLSAFCIALRSIFSFVPYFNPVMAVICLSGAALGSLNGFLTGSLTALLSNFIFGQGPWTLYQMTSWGLLGAVFGLRKIDPAKNRKFSIPLACAASVPLIVLVTGPISDLSSVFMLGVGDIKTFFAVLAGGFVFNLTLAASTVITIAVFSKPFLFALNRVILRLKKEPKS
ncbi:hypothetical protein [Treponema berlinense]|uniref:hypothetical protein n=1 Tax=Treponema berlinense TaxID=225004 RepID=UPI0015BB6576|nr:hypothetical protein [Treponema berlinense]